MKPRSGQRERESGTSTRTGDMRRLRGAWGSGDDVASKAVWSQLLEGAKTMEAKATGLHK